MKEKTINKIVIATGGFDPIHSGHLSYLNAARKLGDALFVGINSDQWLINKKGFNFLPYKERYEIVSNLECVDKIIPIPNDENVRSAFGAIEYVLKNYPNSKIIFANGGDRSSSNTEEAIQGSSNKNIEFAFSVGGDEKMNSSSDIVKNLNSRITERPWGWYKVIEQKSSYKIKELVILPGKSLSMQKHFKRSEFWYVVEGECRVELKNNDTSTDHHLKSHASGFMIPLGAWHRAYNPYDEMCHIIEIQHGDECTEDDIERID